MLLIRFYPNFLDYYYWNNYYLVLKDFCQNKQILLFHQVYLKFDFSFLNLMSEWKVFYS
jgi:hypothetical protein